MRRRIPFFFWLAMVLAAAGVSPLRSHAAADIRAWAEAVQALERSPADERTQRLVFRFLERHPGSRFQTVAQYAAGETLFQRGLYAQALSRYLASQAGGPTDFGDSAAFRIGECHWNTGNVVQAESAWQDLIRRYPQSPLRISAENALIRCLLRQERFALAAERYQDLLARYPSAAAERDVRIGLARIDLSRGRVPEALQRLIPCDSPEALYLKCRCLLDLRRASEASALMSEGNPESGAASEFCAVKAAMALDLAVRADASVAADGLRSALADPRLSAPAVADLQALHAVCLFNAGRYAETPVAAAEALKTAADAQTARYLHYLLGLAYYRLQDREIAKRIWNDATFDAGADDGSRWLVREIAGALFDGGEIEPARRYFELFLQRYSEAPERGEIHERLAQIYYRLGRDAEAVDSYKKYLRSGSVQPAATATPGPAATGRLPIREQAPLTALTTRLESYGKPYACAAAVSALSKTASPWLALLARPPILRINVPARPGAVFSWRFTITADSGKRTLLSRSGHGDLPDEYAWDGRLPDGGQWPVGEPFQVGIILMDKTGKPVNRLNQTERLTAQVYPREGGICVSILTAALFAPGQAALAPQGSSFLKAAGDELLRARGSRLRIEATAEDPALCGARCRAVKDYLSRRFDWSDESWNMAAPLPRDSASERVDIIIN